MRQIGVVFSIFTCVIMMTMFASQVHASGKKTEEGGSAYVKLDPLLLPIIDEDGIQQVVSMVVSIEVASDNAGKVKLYSPRLTDAYIQDMYGILNRHAALKDGIIQVRIIKDRLNKVTDEVLGHDFDTEVLLQLVQQRPI
jgi:flagellar basal body-associated protein FliL